MEVLTVYGSEFAPVWDQGIPPTDTYRLVIGIVSGQSHHITYFVTHFYACFMLILDLVRLRKGYGSFSKIMGGGALSAKHRIFPVQHSTSFAMNRTQTSSGCATCYTTDTVGPHLVTEDTI